VFQQLRGARPLDPWCGFPTDRTLQFATTNAAAALGLDDTTGQLAPDANCPGPVMGIEPVGLGNTMAALICKFAPCLSVMPLADTRCLSHRGSVGGGADSQPG
jgi:hypothetical protein